MTQSVSIERHLWSSGEFFERNPKNVAGELYTTTNQFGEPVRAVRGNMDNVLRMLPYGANSYDNVLLKLDTEEADAPNLENEAAIMASIKATAKIEIQGPPTGSELDLLSFDEIRTRYAANISDDEYRIWTNYQKSRMFNSSVVGNTKNGWSKYATPISDSEYLKYQLQGLVAFDGYDWVPASIYYSGAIYQKIIDSRTDKSKIVAKVGPDAYQAQLEKLESAIPRRLRLADAESERLMIKPNDPFLSQFTILELADNTVFDEQRTILRGFIEWLYSLPKQDFKNGSNAYSVVKYGIERGRFQNKTSTAKKAEIKRKCEMDLSSLFSRFLADLLITEDQQKIEFAWNREFNGFVEYDYSGIPVGFQINRWFKTSLVDPRPALWDGVRFMAANGSAVIAFDVGVGKTMTAILAMAQAMYTGQCKRPLIVLPNPTYQNWLSECVGQYNADGTVKVNGILPQYKDRVNDFFNLRGKYLTKAINEPPQDYSITFITYEGLASLGMSGNLQSEMGGELLTILEQGVGDRDREKLREDIDKMMGNASANTEINFDELGFDYLIFDEAHNAKKIFTKVKGEVSNTTADKDKKAKRESSPYAISDGDASSRGLKTFFLSQYILRRNSMRNVCLLTATPFTNSPLEIYSMLSLVAYQELEKRGIKNIKAFFDKFVEITSELSVNSKGKFENKEVIKGFANRQVLQNIIFSHMIHKTGDEANVPRPIKVVYPRTKDENGITLPSDKQVETALPATELQDYWMKEIARFANGEENEIEQHMAPRYFEDGKVNARDLLAVSFGRQVTLSPYLMKVEGENGKNHYFAGKSDPTPKEIVESSPKLAYTIGAIETIRDWHKGRNEPMSGVVVYINQGVDYIPKIVQYLVEEKGFDKSELAIIKGGMKQDDKEKSKKGFLDGKIKVLFGSATIKEGINLQNKSTCLFNLTLDWNPTDIQQLEGRIWRQNNQHSHVRIITPLIENSVDVFMFQKLEEKTSRINSIWYRAGRANVLDVDNFDPRELKIGLMTDPLERARVDVEMEIDEASNKVEILDESIKELSNATALISQVNDAAERIEQWYNDSKLALASEMDVLKVRISQGGYALKADKDTDERRLKSIEGVLAKAAEGSLPAKFATIKNFARHKVRTTSWPYTYTNQISEVEDQSKRLKQLERLQKNVLNQHGKVYTDDLSPIIADYEGDRNKIQSKLDEFKSDEYFQKVAERMRQEREAADKQSTSVEYRVQQFTTQNHLLSCMAKEHVCATDVKKVVKVIAPAAPAPDKTKRIRLAKAKAAAISMLFEFKRAA
jgi:superfamily II DNA/RNA helicase